MLDRIAKRTLTAAATTSKQARPSVATTRMLSSPPEKSYTERQAQTGRPISPHVSIYDFPPAAISSIANRVTGVILVAGLYGVAGASFAGFDAPAMMSALGSSNAGPAVKVAVSFPLIYHYLGAARHTVWDYMPETLHNASVRTTSYALMGASGLVSLGLAVV